MELKGDVEMELKDKCKDCINNTINGCSLDKEPEDCNMELPLPLLMVGGLL